MKLRNIAIWIGGALAGVVAIKMITRPKGVDWDEVSDKVVHSENSHFVEVDGATVHYQEFGDKAHPTLILIHGYTASAYVWKTVAPMLAENGFHVIAVDLLGFGYSDKPAWFEYSIEAQARMIARFMNRIGIGRATLVGSSYGAAVAATLALDYRERVEKLVLVDAVANDNLRNHPVLKLASIPGLGEILTPFVADSKMYLRRRMHDTLSPANHDLITDERLNSTLRPLRAADAHHSLLATSRNWHAERITRDAGLIDQPTLIIWGEDDTVIPVSDGYMLHEAILNSRLVVLKDCGHVPQEEKSEAFTELVTEFCGGKKKHLEEKDEEAARLAAKDGF